LYDTRPKPEKIVNEGKTVPENRIYTVHIAFTLIPTIPIKMPF